MTEINQTLIGSIISFSIYPSTIITSDFTNVSVLGFGNYEMARGFISPAELHSAVYPTLPEGVPNDYRAYEYIMVRLASGSTTALGIPWILANTVTVDGNIEIIATIRNKSIDDIARLRSVLNQNGFLNVDIKTSPLNT